jgi:purine-binding chemotaxis protein CheW
MADRAHPADDVNVQRILEERARVLASPLLSAEPADSRELVVLTLGSERYGVDAERVREVRPLTDLTPVPGTPPWWAGIVNVRGTLYPVLDLRQYLDVPQDQAGDEPKKVVLVSAAGLEAGLMVGEAPGVQRVPAAAIGPSLGGASEAVRETVRGVTEDLLAVIDVEALLSDPRLVVKEEPT